MGEGGVGRGQSNSFSHSRTRLSDVLFKETLHSHAKCTWLYSSLVDMIAIPRMVI